MVSCGSSSCQGILGAACTVRVSPQQYAIMMAASSASSKSAGEHKSSSSSGSGHSEGALVHGTILEVRRLWRPSQTHDDDDDSGSDDDDERSRSSSSSSRQDDDDDAQTLYAYVRVKDRDHRHSGWYPVDCIELAGSSSSSSSSTTTTTAMAITTPVLSAVYRETTPGMARTLRAEKQLDYLEERLLRDCKSPTTVRYFVYLGAFVFAPWYYAPYGLLHPEYDPLLPYALPRQPPSPLQQQQQQRQHAPLDEEGGGDDDDDASRAAMASSRCVNPYIRDAYLCPFSLRVYSTFAQMRHETAVYRRGRLRPPGTEVYRDEQRHVSLFEVDGGAHVTYCRHLLLIGKSFLENKLAGHDVHNYVFYVCCLHHVYFPHYVDDAEAMYFAGYFSWEKQAEDCNLACIVTLPCFAAVHAQGGSGNNDDDNDGDDGGGDATVTSSSLPPPPQQQRGRGGRVTVPHGIGQFMIAASYALAYRRGQVGSPERPLSDLGAAAYARYWQRQLLRWLHRKTTELLQQQQQQRQEDKDMGSNTAVHSKRQATASAATTMTTTSRRPSASRAAHEHVVIVDVDNDDDDDNDDKEGSADAMAAYASQHDKASATGAATTTLRKRQRGAATATASAPHAQQQQQQQARTRLTGDDDNEPQMTVRDMAQEMGLDEADVVKTLLTMGLLHRNAESRTLRLVIPATYVAHECARLTRRERDMRYCVFDATLLRPQASSASRTTRSVTAAASSSSSSARHAARGGRHATSTHATRK